MKLMKRSKWLLVVLCVFCMPACLEAASVHGDAARGQQIYEGTVVIEGVAACHTCHGKDANQAQTPLFPKLAGQYPEYLAQALLNYKNGGRKNAVMQPMAERLSVDDINDVSTYLGNLPGQIKDLSHLE